MTVNSNFKSARGGRKKMHFKKEEDDLINKIYQVLNDVQDYMTNLTTEVIAGSSYNE
mgnify:CR=1 FL=1